MKEIGNAVDVYQMLCKGLNWAEANLYFLHYSSLYRLFFDISWNV